MHIHQQLCIPSFFYLQIVFNDVTRFTSLHGISTHHLYGKTGIEHIRRKMIAVFTDNT